MKCVEGEEKNGFAGYSIRNKTDEKIDEGDVIPSEQLLNRIESTFKDTTDTIYIDAFFKLIDSDSDEAISYKDLIEMLSQLGL